MRKEEQLAHNKDDLYNNPGSDDLLTQLPDEILVSILSKLPLRAAVTTSLLSRRWRYMWCQTNRLVFEDKERWSLMDTLSNIESNKYMSWVYRIIHQHKSPTIDKFMIYFGLDENDKAAIDTWIKYAISKNVQKLELSLVRIYETCRNYCFPYIIFMEIKFLKSLILRCVDVDDEGLKKILNNCPVLERLSILGSRKLVKPEIHGKGLALKNLEILSCSGLESIEICDSNIVFFHCNSGSSMTLRFDNLQKLEKICIGKGHSCSWKELNDMFCQLSHVPCLQVLELNLYHEQGTIELLPLPKLRKLKQLTIKLVELDDDGLFMLPYLLEACPNLQRLKVMRSTLLKEEKLNRGVRQMPKNIHQYLEVVEMFEYLGWTSDVELFMYFIQNCVPLKKLVIRPTTWDKNAARNHAQQELKPRTPVGVELVIL